ncbi:hypothetical protein AMK16_20505 [Streptomyces sp. CB00455]|uniref:hypothetical protein n=1 Tax=Streptomyces sp. CB00455 TaxID=1703927 RepID=UPI00093FD9EF|nr:hypothetical protein [Streptomyces sp. CB00455]OKK17262.1 hypothetical protein AMK16_20505 [Streptomyces sp. CB00455]
MKPPKSLKSLQSSDPLAARAVRQLRRVRTVYAAGIALWAAAAAWEAWQHPGSRQMWVSLMLMVLFAGLLSLTVVSLWRHRVAVRLRAARRRLTRGRTGVPRPARPGGMSALTR